MSAFKNNTKVSEVDLWKLSGAKEFKELSEKIILDKRVNPDKPYDFQIFSNHYPNGYYVVKVLLNGKIEIEKIKLQKAISHNHPSTPGKVKLPLPTTP